MNNSARIVYHPTFDGRGYTDQNSLVNSLLSTPDDIDPVLTHLMGKESAKFPLSWLSEGQPGEGDMAGSVGVGDIQYLYNVINRLNKPDTIVSHPYTTGNKPGLGVNRFFATFKTNWIKVGFTVETPSGKQVHPIEMRPDGNFYRYTFELYTNDTSDFVPLSDFTVGSKWGMVGGANVAESLSFGNQSNVTMPGKMKQQLSILRKSYELAGNISNKTVSCQFDIDGKKSNLWINFEHWQHMLQWKEDVEEHCWWSRYNRTADGTILNKDPKSNLPIPRMAGVEDQIPNTDTYSVLTAKKIKSTVRDALYGATDTGMMVMDCFAGKGALEEFDTAMKDSASGFTQMIGDKFTTGSGRNLRLGGFYTSYEHIDGHVVNMRYLPLLDHSNRANIAERHPVTGLPMTSYDMYFIDRSVYDGKRNVVMLHENGRSMKTGLVKGMSDVPMNFSGNSLNLNLATDQDLSSIHFMCTKGILIRRNTHCFKLSCDRS